jgi:hypothetical protein
MHTPWIGAQSNSVSRFFDSRKTSIVNTKLNNNAEYVTPQRIEGRVAPTKSMSAVSPGFESFTMRSYTPNIPRTQVTICGAPNPIAIPSTAPNAHPQLIRFAIARPPSTMTKIIATGVSQASKFVCSALAPVRKGEAWANAMSGDAQTSVTSKMVSRARGRGAQNERG